MEQPPEHPTPTPRSRIPLGRAAFLGTIAAGVGGIALLSRFGGGVGSSLASLGDNLGVAAIVPTGGWRIYNVQDPMPTFDPATSSSHVQRPNTSTSSHSKSRTSTS